MPDPIELEFQAESANMEGHEHSFAAGYYHVRGDVDAARSRLRAAAKHYSLSAHRYAEAAVEHLSRSREGGAADRAQRREAASRDCGNAAAEHWYAGRAFADAEEFEPAGVEMEGAAGSYVAEARLREENGDPAEGYTLRRMANFRYLDAARYFVQAAGTLRSEADQLMAEGRSRAAAEARTRAAELEARASATTLKAADEAPKYHQGYQGAYLP